MTSEMTMTSNETRLLVEAIVVTTAIILGGITSLWAYVRARQRTPDVIANFNRTVAEMSERLRIVEHDRQRDHLLIMRLQTALEVQRAYSRLLADRLRQAGILDIPPAPDTAVDVEPPVVNRATLVAILASLFNVDEINDLAFQMDIDADDLSGDTVTARARALVTYCHRHGTMDVLIKTARVLRPDGGI